MSKFESFFVRVTARLYDSYTGAIGAYLFKDGVSVEKMHRNDAINFSHGFSCDALDDDGQFLCHIISGRVPTDLEMQTAKPLPKYKRSKPVAKPKKTKGKTPVVNHEPNPEQVIYSREQLEAIADGSGLAGLREIGDPIGAKAKSIPALIEKILGKQV